jgi:V/A-type H+-transporting ATPase subunit I
MKMLNIAFLMGLVHILFGMGIRMVANFRAGLVTDAIFDNLFWIIFLVALAPLGYSAILGGTISPQISFWSSRASLVLAAAIFLTGGRKQKNIIAKFFKGLLGFYDIVGYFGDVLSYARLLALGLATSAIALAVNGIAQMVSGLPYYTGYVAAVLVLLLGHLFNLAVNTLGAFVHSGRLQYLEFFSKFFAGGGKEFRPFKTERSYSICKRPQE